MDVTCRAGTARPEDPVAFIAECFLTGEIPDTDGMPGAEAEQPLGAYITEHRVVELVQQAVGICAAAQPPPENPLLVVGQHLRVSAYHLVTCARAAILFWPDLVTRHVCVLSGNSWWVRAGAIWGGRDSHRHPLGRAHPGQPCWRRYGIDLKH